MPSPRLSAAAHARLREYARGHAHELVLVLAVLLTASPDVGDFVSLVLAATEVDGVHRPAMVSVVPRGELGAYLPRAEARIIPTSGADALPVFVKSRGESHASLLPITGDLRRLRGRGAPPGPAGT